MSLCYNIVKLTIYFLLFTRMDDILLIEQQFSEALRQSEREYGRGFQVRVAEISGVQKSTINKVLKRAEGCSEQSRKSMLLAVLKLLPSFPAKTYDDFLDFGQWLLDKKPAEEWRGKTWLPIPPACNKEEILVKQETGQNDPSNQNKILKIYEQLTDVLLDNKKLHDRLKHIEEKMSELTEDLENNRRALAQEKDTVARKEKTAPSSTDATGAA